MKIAKMILMVSFFFNYPGIHPKYDFRVFSQNDHFEEVSKIAVFK